MTDTLMQLAGGFAAALTAINLVWAQEACIYLFVWMAKFGAAYGVRIGIHVGVDVLVQRLEGTAKKVVTVIAMSGASSRAKRAASSLLAPRVRLRVRAGSRLRAGVARAAR